VQSVTGTKKTRKPRIVEENAHIVHITGKDTNLAKINPIALSEKIKTKFGIVKRIYLSGASLKIYCTSLEQKITLLGATLLDEIQISSSEPIIGLHTRSVIDENKLKVCKGVISGVSLDIEAEDICKETCAMKVIRAELKGAREYHLTLCCKSLREISYQGIPLLY